MSSNEPRDQLARVLDGALARQQSDQSWMPPEGESLCLDGFFVPRALADAVVAAGWRPPLRVIEDRTELEALPVGTIVRDAEGDAARRDDDGYCWSTGGGGPQWWAALPLPAAVLWEPEEVDRG